MEPSYYDDDAKKGMPLKDARPVTFKVMEDHVFWLHRSVNGKGWSITEPRTGLYIANSKSTQRKARTSAEANLDKRGRAGVLKVIQSVLKRRAEGSQKNRSSAKRSKL